MTRKIFITSTGTDIGKTFFTCALIEHLRNVGLSVHAIKPVMTGFEPTSIPNDIFYLANSLAIPYVEENIKKINFQNYAKPLSPDMAARLEKKPQISFDLLNAFCERATSEASDILLIEGAGGVMAPINESKTFLDLIGSLADQVILVTGSYLGSLSHIMTAYKALESIGKKPALLVVSQSLLKSEEIYIPVMETIKSLEKFVSAPIIGVEKMTGTEVVKIQKLSKILTDAKISDLIGRQA